jgi:hypothetical protein
MRFGKIVVGDDYICLRFQCLFYFGKAEGFPGKPSIMAYAYKKSLFVRQSIMESAIVCQWQAQPMMLRLFIFRQYGSMVGR